MNPKEQADFDQSSKSIADNIPMLLWSLYKGFVKEGFSEHDSLELIKVYLAEMLRGTAPDA